MNLLTVADREITFEREFHAPRKIVFKAWTDCTALSHWFGPKDWTLPACEMDLRPGGRWRYGMRGPNGEESWGLSIFREVVEPERLVYTDNFTDAAGNVNTEMPEMDNTVIFEEHGGKTLVKMRTLAASVEQVQRLVGMGMEEGWKQTLDRLDAYLASSAA